MRVFVTSPWLPAEWIRAHGHEPRGIWFEKDFGFGAPPLSAGVCAFAERVVCFAQAHPADAVIFTTACDQMRRGFDAAVFRSQQRLFLFNLPATLTPAARQIYRAEVERLGQFLVELGGRAPATEMLRQEMRRADGIRHRLREAAPSAAARTFAEALAKFHGEGIFPAPPPDQATNHVPLALLGGPLSPTDWNLFDMTESVGGRIALNGTKTGERSLCPTFENQNLGDEGVAATDALVAGYFENIVDVFQRPNSRLYSWLRPRLATRQIRGIVLWHFTGCDLWRAEAQTMREVVGLPVLLLEADEAAGISPRDVNRLQSFVEMLKAEG